MCSGGSGEESSGSLSVVSGIDGSGTEWRESDWRVRVRDFLERTGG